MSKKRSKRLTIYNHKGGVGKTTLTVNLAFALAEAGKSVLLVDTDPQCNLTSYLLSDEYVDALLDNSDTDDGETVWSAVRNIISGTGALKQIDTVPVGDFNLLPGDIRLSEYEDFLHESWVNSFQRRVGGLRATTSISELVQQVTSSKDFEFVFYDTGPNIGPLNRVLLLDSDFFVVPVACDLFSMRALSTLGQTLKRWIVDWETIASIAPDGAPLLNGRPRFMGYIPQRFKVYGQAMASEPRKYLKEIRRRVFQDITDVLRKIAPDLAPRHPDDPALTGVPDMASLVQQAQRDGVALWNANMPAAYDEKKIQAKEAFSELAEEIMTITDKLH